jgi:hypothetical protein
LSAVESIEHLNEPVLPGREEVASDENGGLSLRRVVEMGDREIRRLKKGVTGPQEHRWAIDYLESDQSGDHPADDRTGVQVKPGRLGRSELDARHFDALYHRLGLKRCIQQGLAHNGRRL